jgi:hypothetical protein
MAVQLDEEEGEGDEREEDELGREESYCWK